MGGEVWFMCQIDAIGRSPSKIVTRQDGVYIRTYLYGCEWPCVGDSGMEWGGTWIVSMSGVPMDVLLCLCQVDNRSL